MHYREFGNTGLSISALTFGAMRIPSVDDDQAVATVHRAVALGINHLETARGYGKSEEQIGKALVDLDRGKLVITTKIGPTSKPGEMRQYIEESLTRMGISFIDNLDVHGINTSEILGNVLAPGGCLSEIRQAVDEGLVRHVGFSTHGPVDVVTEAIETGEFESVNLHYYYFNQRNEPAVRTAEKREMGVLIISPTDKGGMLQSPTEKLTQITAPFTSIELNHRFLLSDPAITTVTVGAKHPDELNAHMVVAGRTGALTDQERKALLRVENQLATLGDTYCSFCYECLPCPTDVNIPEALRLRNLAKALNMLEFGRYRYDLLGNGGHWFPGEKGDKCNDCGDCLPRCPLKLDIPKLLRETHEMLHQGEGKRLWGET